MTNARSLEVQLWWPIPLAIIIWLSIIWGTGFILTPPEDETVAPKPIEARFVELPELPELVPEQKSPPPPPPPPPQPSPSAPAIRPPVQPQVKPRAIAKPVVPPVEKKQTETARETAAKPTHDPIVDTSVDMMDYVNQTRARRRAEGIIHQHEVRKTPPSEDEINLARVKRNLQPPNTRGVFQITHIGQRTAQFSFRGWMLNDSHPRRELIAVTAGPDGDIKRAIIRQMIHLIRKHHQGNFNWESYRLNSVVVLSARMDDNAGLEDFLLREFFDEFSGLYR